MIRPQGEPIVVPLGAASTIDLLVARWRSDVSADSVRKAPGNGPVAARASGTRLRRAIWDGLSPHIADATTLFVVPDDALSLVPLAALPGTQSEFVLEEAPVIHYLTAERDLIQAEEHTRESAQGLLAVGGPAFDDESDFSINGTGRLAGSPATGAQTVRSAQSQCDSFQTMQFSPLAGTVQEVQDVAQLWRGISGAVPARAPRLERSYRATIQAGSTEASESSILRHTVSSLGRPALQQPKACGPSVDLVAGTNTRAHGLSPLVADSPLLLSGVALAGANRRAVPWRRR